MDYAVVRDGVPVQSKQSRKLLVSHVASMFSTHANDHSKAIIINTILLQSRGLYKRM